MRSACPAVELAKASGEVEGQAQAEVQHVALHDRQPSDASGQLPTCCVLYCSGMPKFVLLWHAKMSTLCESLPLD